MTAFRLGLALAAAAAGLAAPALGPAPTEQGPSTADWPVRPASVVRAFDQTTTYGPGHRGIDLVALPRQSVHAALRGEVVVAGTVAGRPLVVLMHAGGLRTTYLPVSPQVEVGELVEPGAVIGRVPAPGHCLDISCLHWGARDGDGYIDPRTLMPRAPVVLLPL
jgi:murein DD-endopeptidase MepM/ murein hydrolase activator NlpD